MASSPSGVGGRGLELDFRQPPTETLAEMKPATDRVEVYESRGDESGSRNEDGDVDREKGEEEIGNGDSKEKGEVMIGGEIDEKVGSFVYVERKGEVEGDGDSKENDQRFRYEFRLQEDETGFAVDDLVWGKVKSHPWWPGQIFDPKYASDMALKWQKNDHFLVAYFGDKTFAWVPASQLKPFQAHFSAMEKQSGIEPFANAVYGVLEEVSRRVELGMACHCLADEVYADIKYKKVENAGIREGTCSAAVDRSIFVDAFQPDALLEYIRALATCSFGEFDRLELTVATAQLKAFYRSKGYCELGVFIFGGGLVENDADIPPSMSEISEKGKSTGIVLDIRSGKRRRGRPRKSHVTEDDNDHKEVANQLASLTLVASRIKSGKRPRGRPRKNSEQMEEKEIDYFGGGGGGVGGGGGRGVYKGKTVASASLKKQMVVDSDLKRRKDVGVGEEVHLEIDAPSSARARSLKVGDRISRAASQLTESVDQAAILKSVDETLADSVAKRNNRKGAYHSSKAAKENEVATEDYSSPSEMLTQLCLTAKNPDVAYHFLPMLIGFFTKLRDFLSSNFSEDQELVKSMGKKGGRRKKAAISDPPSSEVSEPDYMQDTYWSDILLESEIEPEAKDRKRKGSSHKKGRKKKTRTAGEPPTDVALRLDKQHGLLGNQEVRGRVINNIVETAKEETPTALILSFNESDALPSIADLIKIFSPYGPLREEETEILRKTKRAKVVFKYHLDAEKAYSSTGKYSVFGPSLLSYRLRYSPSSKSSLTTSPQGENDAIPTKDDDLEHQGITLSLEYF